MERMHEIIYKPPVGCILSNENATMPSLINAAYFLLRPIICAKAAAIDGVTSWSIAAFLRWAHDESVLLDALVDQMDLMALTNTRVPSLFAATESERRTSARI